MNIISTLLIILVGYTLGCFATGYYLVCWRTGQDIRELGSGTAGTRNVGRVLGKTGAVFALLGDVLKGVFAVGLAIYFELSLMAMMLTFIVVIAGHIWPLQLGFRGGKGLATGIGAVAVIDLRLALAILLIAGILSAITRKLSVGALTAVALAPLVAQFMGHPPVVWGSMVLLAIIVLYAHRANIFPPNSKNGKDPH